jgi:CxxC-x17-CxxC domain-containing protein
MKKRVKEKKSKDPSGPVKNELPELVAIMTKIAERLEALEKKTNLVISQTAVRLPELSSHTQTLQRPAHVSQQNHNPRERILYDAVCADCCKSCKVPFKPSENRPVYCPECFAIRKAGHVPKDPTAHVVVPQHLRETKTAPGGEDKAAVVSQSKKSKSKKQKTARKKK